MTDQIATPHYGHAPIKMRRSEKDGFWGRGKIAVGDFYWRHEPDGSRRMLCVLIPFQCESGYTFSQWTIGFDNHCGAKWEWDGNEDCPTITPSLHAVGVWHGWVKNGELVEA